MSVNDLGLMEPDTGSFWNPNLRSPRTVTVALTELCSLNWCMQIKNVVAVTEATETARPTGKPLSTA